MGFYAKYRLPAEMYEEMQSRFGKYRGVSIAIREAMDMVIKGETLLTPKIKNFRASTFACDEQQFEKFKSIAENASMSYEAAMVEAISHYLKTQPQKDQDHATDIQT